MIYIDSCAVSVTQEESSEAEKAIEEVQKEIGKLEEKENKLNSENIEVKHELEKYENSVADFLSKIKHWKKEVSSNFGITVIIIILLYLSNQVTTNSLYVNVLAWNVLAEEKQATPNRA